MRHGAHDSTRIPELITVESNGKGSDQAKCFCDCVTTVPEGTGFFAISAPVVDSAASLF